MTVKNILIVGAAGVALIYWLSNQKVKAPVQVQQTQYGGYGSHPVDNIVAAETGTYRL